MLPRRNRLTRQAFSSYFKNGRRFHSPTLTLIYTPHTSLEASAVISKKVAKSAVRRNKFRRRIYDVFERLSKESALRGAFICIAKGKAAEADYSDLKAELLALVHKTGVLR